MQWLSMVAAYDTNGNTYKSITVRLYMELSFSLWFLNDVNALDNSGKNCSHSGTVCVTITIV